MGIKLTGCTTQNSIKKSPLNIIWERVTMRIQLPKALLFYNEYYTTLKNPLRRSGYEPNSWTKSFLSGRLGSKRKFCNKFHLNLFSGSWALYREIQSVSGFWLSYRNNIINVFNAQTQFNLGSTVTKNPKNKNILDLSLCDNDVIQRVLSWKGKNCQSY